MGPDRPATKRIGSTNRDQGVIVKGLQCYLWAGVVLALGLGALPYFAERGWMIEWRYASPMTLIAALTGGLLLLAGFGLDVSGTPLGCLQTGRNALSLSRLQMLLWTVLALSGLTAAATCRAWGQWHGSLATALQIYIPGDLLAAMGISYFTGAAAPAVLAVKAQGSTDPSHAAILTERKGETMIVRGRVASRPFGARARLGDLVEGDEVGSAGVVDFSKVQQLLVTLLLVAVYAAVLMGLFLYGPQVNPADAAAVAAAKDGQTPLPGFSDDFIKLLLLSHGGYLAYKVAPKSAPATDGSATPAGEEPPPPPDRNAPLTV